MNKTIWLSVYSDIKQMLFFMWGMMICLSPFMLKEPDGLIFALPFIVSLPLFLYAAKRSELKNDKSE